MKALAPGCCVLLAACGFHPGGGNNSDAAGTLDTPSDGPAVHDGPTDGMQLDAMPDAPSGFCFGHHTVQVCSPTMPTDPFPSIGDLDTSLPTSCDLTPTPAGGPQLCVILATSVTLNQTLFVSGSRPLVIVSSGAITIPGGTGIDASSDATSNGPGANPTDCGASAGQPGGTVDSGGGGGGGGSFGTLGGLGGAGNLNGGGGAGAAGAVAAGTVLRGGCPGGPGGAANTGTVGGPGGAGGGAVYLIANGTITVNASINASAAGGFGGQMGGGGGGGGAGGMIGLDAQAITLMGAGALFANGGGGGEGTNLAASQGGNGGASQSPLQAGRGGAGGSAGGGDGGDGATGASLPGLGLLGGASSGGGGGGGGTGVIQQFHM